MNKISAVFFATGALFGLMGMAWGIHMGISGDHSLSPAHGHLNLIGFVAMSIFGTFYALNGAAGASRLAVIHYIVTVIAVAVMVPGIAIAHSGGEETLVKAGSVIAILSMAIFLFTTLKSVFGNRAA